MCLADKTYTVLLLKKAIRPQYSEIQEATTVGGDLMRKVVARILHDRAESVGSGVDLIDPATITVTPAGAYADNMYGYMLQFNVCGPYPYALDENDWL